MINLSKIFHDFFEDSTITNARYIDFSNDHIEKLEKNNSSFIYSSLIEDTQNCVHDLQALSNQKSNELVLDNNSILDSHKNKIVKFLKAKEEELLKNADQSLVLRHHLFPNGIKKIEESNHSEFRDFLFDLITNSIKYKKELGQLFISELKAFQHIYEITHQQLKHENGNTSLIKSIESKLRKGLSLQLTKNALTIAINNLGETESHKKFFDVNLLYAKQRRFIYKDMVDSHSNLIFADIEYNSNKRLRIKNKGSVVIGFQMTLNGFPVGNIHNVYPSKVIDKSFSEFFSDGNGLQAINKSNTSCFFLVNEIA